MEDRARAWGTRFTLLAYVVMVACLPLLDTGLAAREAQPLPSLGDVRGVATWIATAALHALWLVVRFVPLGFLAVLAAGNHETQRPFVRNLAALLVAVLAAIGLLVLERGRPWHLPGALAAGLAVFACVVGTWMGTSWQRGWRARAWILPKLAAGALVLLVAGGFLARRVLDEAPMSLPQPRLSTEEKRRLRGLFAGKNPQVLLEGETVRVRLREKDLQGLVAWGLALTKEGIQLPAEFQVALGSDGMTLLGTASLPWGLLGRRHANVTARADLAIDEGTVSLGDERLRVGAVDMPRGIARPVLRRLVDSVAVDRRVQPALSAVKSLRIDGPALVVEYGRLDVPAGLLSELFGGEDTVTPLVPAIREHVLNLIPQARTMPTGEGRFGAAIRAAFAFAQERSQVADPVDENRAAVVALGILLDHRVESIVGPVMDEATREAARKALKGSTLHGRDDWPRHFTGSASLVALVGETGLFKEELEGGKGLSFTDLLAERAGALFGRAATRDAEAAVAMQERLARGFAVDDFLPSPDGLPEFVTTAELESRYGGVGGEGYQQQVAEIDRRLALAPGLQ